MISQNPHKGISLTKRILLFTGDLNSLIAYRYLQRNFGEAELIHCKLGLQKDQEEIKSLKAVAAEIKRSVMVEPSINLSFQENNDNTVPLKVMYMLMTASKYGDHICVPAPAGENVESKNRTQMVFWRASRVLSETLGRRIVCDTLFDKMTKSMMVKWYNSQNLPESELVGTRDCYSGKNGDPCWNCNKCFRRWVALINNNIFEVGHEQMAKSVVTKSYITNLSLHTPERQHEITSAVANYQGAV